MGGGFMVGFAGFRSFAFLKNAALDHALLLHTHSFFGDMLLLSATHLCAISTLLHKRE